MTFIEHLSQRGVRDFSTIIIGDAIYFLLYTLSGKLVGVQRYNPDGRKDARGSMRKRRTDVWLKYLTYVREGEIGVWGLHSIKEDTKIVFLTEGIFDAVSIHNTGNAAVAMLTANPKPFKQWLDLLPYILVSAVDNDVTGKLLAKYGDYSVKPDSAYKDWNEMPQYLTDAIISHIKGQILSE